ncbi:MAG TPA: DUF5916 domain-containing protein [Gemmatimonadota bacterium]|nr:DUF5916 domain-containing protein [Gemmatimonadota bacterium]
MLRSALYLSVALALIPAAAAAQTAGAPVDIDRLVTPPAGTPEHERRAPGAVAVPVEGEIELDGRLDEPVWQRAPAVTRFIQREPEEGAPATQRTEVRFAYDDNTLYIGARMFDDRGEEGIVSRLVRRDADADSDQLTISFDTFLDHLGETQFTVNPAGVRGDAFGPGGSHLDPSWNPVWRAKSQIDSLGWTAEIAIPFSQLRFRRGVEQVWGLQIAREIQRLNEFQVWSFWRQDQQGGPSRYGHLTGIEAARSGIDRLEILPYAVAQMATQAEIDPDNPFEHTRDSKVRVGADLKYLLTSDLTVTATVNPDFGQAEVDPAVVNLSAFETFFPEKREFFIEGSGLFSFGGLWCFTCSNISSLDMLFTRRIGRQPQAAQLATSAGEFAEIPDATSILAAAKLTGRTRSGTSIGILGAATEREQAEVVSADGSRFDQEVMPLTGYFVGRVKQDFRQGDLQVGGIMTSVSRSFDDPALEDVLASHSEGLGVDAEWWWSDRTYHFLGSAAMTNVSGSEEAILRLQQSSARFFQRPDRDHGSNGLFTDRFDPTLDAIRGYGLYARVAKDAGAWRWESQVNVRSPGFENNDIAFLTRTDYVYMLGNLQRRWTAPTSLYRYFQWNVGAQQQFNYDGDLTSRQFHGSLFTVTPFYWEASVFGLVRPSTLDDRLTRGGPVVRAPAHGYHELYLATDRRKPVGVEFIPSFAWNEEGARDYGLNLELNFKPASNVSLSLGPSFRRFQSTAQFVTAVDDPTAEEFFGRRYVFADLEQKTLSMDTRINWTFTPSMSLELFAQPFVSSNDFSRFKEFAAPRELDKEVYGIDRGTIRTEGEGNARELIVDPDGAGPAAPFSFDDPDFNFRSLRGNLVFRWEYLPGSTLFLVWTQDRNSRVPFGDFRFGRDVDDLFAAGADNVFLIKATYWLGI